MDYLALIVGLVMSAILAYREWMNWVLIERLLDRLMSKDVVQYKNINNDLQPRRGRRIHAMTDEEMADLEEKRTADQSKE